jgi:large-conductance mechanosensitive channel
MSIPNYNINEFKKFIIDNGIVSTTAGVIIAITTKDLIVSFIGDIIIPSMLILFMRMKLNWITNIMYREKVSFNFTNFINLFVTWGITLIITYYFIKTIFHSLLGISVMKQSGEDQKNK